MTSSAPRHAPLRRLLLLALLLASPCGTALAAPGPTPYPELARRAGNAQPPAARAAHAAPSWGLAARSRLATPAADSGGAGTPAWIQMGALARSWPCVVYDPVGGRVIVVGGDLGRGGANDVWQLTLVPYYTNQWKRLVPRGAAPPPLAEAASIYDPVRQRMVIFGGRTGDAAVNNVWALTLDDRPTWWHLTPSGTPPSPRMGCTAVYDSVGDRMLVFGGLEADGSTMTNDVWELRLDGVPRWRQIQPVGSAPEPRAYHSAVSDRARNSLVVFGGVAAWGEEGIPTSLFGDTWALSLTDSTWTQVATGGTAPSGRAGQTAVAFPDSCGYGMVMFGGWSGDSALNDTWRLSYGDYQWTEFLPPYYSSLPAGRVGHAAVALGGCRMMVFGGSPSGSGSDAMGDAWVFEDLQWGPYWSEVYTTPVGPPGGYDFATVYDSDRERMVIFGGISETQYHGADLTNDVWSLAIADSVRWLRPMYAGGALPSARAGHSAVYDPVWGRTIVFGGWDGSYLDDVYTLSANDTAAVWWRLFPTGLPPGPRWGHSAIYDAVGERMVVFGGYDGTALRNDIWALELLGIPRWQRLNPYSSPPSVRYDHSAIYDPVGRRMVIFGGADEYGGGKNDTWVYSLNDNTWTELSPSGDWPPDLSGHCAVYDPGRGTMLVYGGQMSQLETWSLSLGGSPQWSHLGVSGNLPDNRAGAGAVFFPERDCAVVFGGTGYGQEFWADTWQFAPEGLTAGVGGSAPAGRPRGVTVVPNPAFASVRFDLDVPFRVQGRAAIYDLAGRKVLTLAQGEFEAGRRTLTWDGAEAGGSRAPAGVYFCRVELGRDMLTRRFVLLR